MFRNVTENNRPLLTHEELLCLLSLLTAALVAPTHFGVFDCQHVQETDCQLYQETSKKTVSQNQEKTSPQTLKTIERLSAVPIQRKQGFRDNHSTSARV